MMPLILSAAMKGTVGLTLAWAATLMLRKSSADLRHRFWLAALACLPLFLIPIRMPQAAQMNFTFTAESIASAATWAPFPWIYVWAAGAALLLVRFAWNVLRLARITGRAEGTSIRISSEIASPMTWGVIRPVILLPSYASDWTHAIEHERIHIARADWLTQSYAQLVTAVFWFHPLVWFASARLRAEAEQAVDDAVLNSGADAATYAAELVAVARRMNESSPQTAVAMVRTPELIGRVALILDVNRTRHSRAWKRIAVMAVTLCIVPLLAAFQAPPEGGTFVPPKVVYKVQPVYPPDLKAAKVQGEVWLDVVVGVNGTPTDISVTQSPDPGLSGAAIESVSQWRFEPGTKDGVPLPVKATISINFKLL